MKITKKQLKNIIREVIEENVDLIQQDLYHATYGHNLDSIMKQGLIPNSDKIWSDSKNYVYLADDPYVAESYAEAAEDVPEEWLDDIVILEIKTSGLDKSKLSKDKNVIDGDSTYQYDGVIPPEYITIYN